jgi:hypothetical protein
MANLIKVFTYGDQNGGYATGTYKVRGLPSNLLSVAPPPSGVTTMAGVTINSEITVLPTGLIVPNAVTKYYSDITVANAITAANAALS